jgi:hypothetical protein
MYLSVTTRFRLGIILDVDLKRKIAKTYIMELKKILKGFQYFILILASMHLQAQNSITYNGNNLAPENRLITFVDTLQDKIVLSFSPSELCPYWNLPYPVIPTSNPNGYGTEKRFDLKDVSSISNLEIPGLVIVENRDEINNPLYASSSFTCKLSPNGQWIIIESYLNINGYDDCLGFANYIEIYSSDGNLYRTLLSKDGYISDVQITDDGLFLVYGHLGIETYKNDFRDFGYKIINITTMEIELELRDNVDNMNSLYNKTIGNYIFIMKEIKDDGNLNISKEYGYLSCFDMKNNEKFTGIVKPELKWYSNLIGISKEGISFRVNNDQDSNRVLMQFDKDFHKGRIQ